MELKDNSVDLTEEGVALAEMVLETNDLWDENDPWARCFYMLFFNLQSSCWCRGAFNHFSSVLKDTYVVYFFQWH